MQSSNSNSTQETAGSFPWLRLQLVPGLGIGLAFILVYPFNWHSRPWSEVFNLAHAPSFFCVFLFIAGILDPSSIGCPRHWKPLKKLGQGHLILLAAILLLIGSACEFLQKFVGRSPSISDALANGTGLAAALFWCLGRQATSRVSRIGMSLITVGLLIVPSWSPIAEIYDCMLQQREFPGLASFERKRELHAWVGHEATIQTTNEWATHGVLSMKVQGRAGTRFPGALFEWPTTNWTGFETLELDALNSSEHPIDLQINVTDALHMALGNNRNDRFHTSIELPPGKPTAIRILLADIRNAPASRTMNLDQINTLNIFVVKPDADITFLVDHIRLTTADDQ